MKLCFTVPAGVTTKRDTFANPNGAGERKSISFVMDGEVILKVDTWSTKAVDLCSAPGDDKSAETVAEETLTVPTLRDHRGENGNVYLNQSVTSLREGEWTPAAALMVQREHGVGRGKLGR